MNEPRSVVSGRLLVEIARDEGGDVEKAAEGDPPALLREMLRGCGARCDGAKADLIFRTRAERGRRGAAGRPARRALQGSLGLRAPGPPSRPERSCTGAAPCPAASAGTGCRGGSGPARSGRTAPRRRAWARAAPILRCAPVDQRLGPPGARPVKPGGRTSFSSTGVRSERCAAVRPEQKPTWCSAPVVVVEPEQQRADDLAPRGVAKAADDAVRGPQALDLPHAGPLAGLVGQIDLLGDHAVEGSPRRAEPAARRFRVAGRGREPHAAGRTGACAPRIARGAGGAAAHAQRREGTPPLRRAGRRR